MNVSENLYCLKISIQGVSKKRGFAFQACFGGFISFFRDTLYVYSVYPGVSDKDECFRFGFLVPNPKIQNLIFRANYEV